MEKRQWSLIRKGKKWFNDGETQVLAFECPEGFVPGMLSRNLKMENGVVVEK